MTVEYRSDTEESSQLLTNQPGGIEERSIQTGCNPSPVSNQHYSEDICISIEDEEEDDLSLEDEDVSIEWTDEVFPLNELERSVWEHYNLGSANPSNPPLTDIIRPLERWRLMVRPLIQTAYDMAINMGGNAGEPEKLPSILQAADRLFDDFDAITRIALKTLAYSEDQDKTS